LEIGLSYASNAGNLRLSLADFVEEQAAQLAEQIPEKVETQ